MTMEKTLTNLKKYICVSCDFECSQKGNIIRHNLTVKHKNNTTTMQKTLNQKLNGIQIKLLVQFLIYRDEFPDCKKSSSHLSNKYNKFTVSINSNCDKIFNNKILLNVIKNIVIPK
jgi:hypothetical protein